MVGCLDHRPLAVALKFSVGHILRRHVHSVKFKQQVSDDCVCAGTRSPGHPQSSHTGISAGDPNISIF